MPVPARQFVAMHGCSTDVWLRKEHLWFPAVVVWIVQLGSIRRCANQQAEKLTKFRRSRRMVVVCHCHVTFPSRPPHHHGTCSITLLLVPHQTHQQYVDTSSEPGRETGPIALAARGRRGRSPWRGGFQQRRGPQAQARRWRPDSLADHAWQIWCGRSRVQSRTCNPALTPFSCMRV